MANIKDLIRVQDSEDEVTKLDAYQTTLLQQAAQAELTKLEHEFDTEKQYHLEQLIKMPTASFAWFMDNLVLPCIKPNSLNGSAKIDDETLYSLVLSDGFSDLYVEYLKAKRRISNA